MDRFDLDIKALFSPINAVTVTCCCIKYSKCGVLRVLTPSEERRQAPAQRVRPGRHEDEESPLPRQHSNGCERPRDDEVTVDSDHRHRDHGADPKQSATEGIELATCRRQRESRFKRLFFPVTNKPSSPSVSLSDSNTALFSLS